MQLDSRLSVAPPFVALRGATPRTAKTAAQALLAQPLHFAATDVASALAWCVEVARTAPLPGAGATAELWEILATVAAFDVGVARMLEPHLDALSILDQAGNPDLSALGVSATSSWGVFAAEGRESRLDATEHGAQHTAGPTAGQTTEWTLDGTKVWCSLAGDLSHALVTAFVGGTADEGGTERRLFAINLHDDGVSVHDGPWTARGLQQVRSTPITLDRVRAHAIGGSNWYLERPGFQWGGIGVAACWWGGAIGVSRTLFTRLLESPADPILSMHAGAVDASLSSCRAVLADAAAQIDQGASTPRELAILAKRVRAQVFETAEASLRHTAHALGPTPLVSDDDHARRVADLDLYIRQYHAERDSASLGRLIREEAETPW